MQNCKSTASFSPAKRICGRRRAQRGQTAVLALMVMLLLAFAGALFVTIVARNLVNAGRQNRVETADYYAQAGIKFADDQLTNSDLGADWRPAKVDVSTLNAKDPDYSYLNATPAFTRYNMGNGRFLLRVTYVTAPGSSTAVTDNQAGYIKIESVGREGVVDPTDPTTFTTTAQQQNATLVAWKAIGITQYGLFVTNPDQRSDVANIGVQSMYDDNSTNDVQAPGIVTPGVVDFNKQVSAGYQQYPIVTTLGAPNAYIVAGTSQLTPNPNAGRGTVSSSSPGNWTESIDGQSVAPGGGTFRSNGSARFFGLNNVYLNSQGYSNYIKSTAGVQLPPSVLDEHMEISGDLLLDSYNPGTTSSTRDLNVQDAAVVLNPVPGSATTPLQSYVTPTSDPNGFDTKDGAVRDGVAGNDANGYAREVKRLEPPVIDNVESATGLTRYRNMAINSPARNSNWTIPNPGRYGFGQIIYVDNTTDTQSESSVAGTGYSLTDEWLKKTQGNAKSTKYGWKGSIYTPPGVDITLGDMRPYGFVPTSSNTSNYGVYLLRDSDDKTWPDPGKSSTTAGIVDSGSRGLIVPYDELGASNQEGTTSSDTNPITNPNNDVIIVCEGNVRIHGIASADPTDKSGLSGDNYPRHITIVTYGTAYIEGNLLRGNPDSSIAVLAHDYVCVNTTQFTAGHVIPNEPTASAPSATSDGAGALDFGAGEGLSEELQYGLLSGGTPASEYKEPATGTSTATADDVALYVEGQTGDPLGGDAVLDFNLDNPRLNLPGQPAVPPTTVQQVTFGSTHPSITTFPIGDTAFNEIGGVSKTLSQLIESEPLRLWMEKDPSSTSDPQLSRVAVLPMDIRIEALLYAQTRSFFVIPGDWFNNHSDDTIDKFIKGDPTTGVAPFTKRGAGIDPNNNDPNQERYPFYGQPIDLRITIYGAVSEAYPADIGAQTDWMKKWGWIPQYHGGLLNVSNNGEPAGHLNPNSTATTPMPAVGLSIVYNPQCGYPLATNANSGQYLRYDEYGRPLPFAPRLPVCPGLIYSGEIPQLPSS